nr:hypothetical protein [Tanacetum cinerariifolium]
MVKGPLDASEDTLLSLRSEGPNLKIQEKEVEYLRALTVALLKVVFAGLVDVVSSMIDAVFDISESNMESMQVRGKFAEFSKDKGSVQKVLSATKLSKGGNSHSAYSSYHLEGMVNFEGAGNGTSWAANVERRKRVKCYVQVSGRRKRKKVIGRGSGSLSTTHFLKILKNSLEALKVMKNSLEMLKVLKNSLEVHTIVGELHLLLHNYMQKLHVAPYSPLFCGCD